MSVTPSIKALTGSEHGNTAVFLVLFAFIIGDAIPTPADSAFFTFSRKLREDYFTKQITPEQYWTRLGESYYLFSVIWWVLVALIVLSVGGSANTKFKVLIGLISGGILIAVLHNLIVKDEKQQALQQQALIPKT